MHRFQTQMRRLWRARLRLLSAAVQCLQAAALPACTNKNGKCSRSVPASSSSSFLANATMPSELRAPDLKLGLKRRSDVEAPKAQANPKEQKIAREPAPVPQRSPLKTAGKANPKTKGR